MKRGLQTLAAGRVISDRYCVLERLASGAMGEVWTGRHLHLRQPLAIKTLLPEARRVPELVTRFEREAILLGKIHSDHVARAIDFLPDTGYGPLLVMELIEGQPLDAMFGAKQLSVESAIDLGIDIARALSALHLAGVVHRDIKPSNIIARRLADGSHRAVLVDLGVARSVAHAGPGDDENDDVLTEITRIDYAIGTIEYMAPEQIVKSSSVTPAADIYSLGAILFRAVAGSNVFGDARGFELARRKLSSPAPRLLTGRADPLAKSLEDTVARMLESSPSMRYESADELLADLLLLRDRANKARFAAPLPSRPSTPLARPALKASRVNAKVAAAVRAIAVKQRHARSVIACVLVALLVFLLVTLKRHGSATAATARAAPAVDGVRCKITERRTVSPQPGQAPRTMYLVACDDAPSARALPTSGSPSLE